MFGEIGATIPVTSPFFLLGCLLAVFTFSPFLPFLFPTEKENNLKIQEAKAKAKVLELSLSLAGGEEGDVLRLYVTE